MRLVDRGINVPLYGTDAIVLDKKQIIFLSLGERIGEGDN